MPKRLGQTLKRHADRAIAANGSWLQGVPAIVADNDDEERQHRVRVIIPSIDENEIFDEWARQMVFCLGSGFGSAFIPPIGSEVVLFGQLGQKFNLFYASLYNEEMTVPEGFDNEMTAGAHVPGNLKLIAEQLAHLKGETLELIASALARLMGDQIRIEGADSIQILGGTVTVNSDGSIAVHASGNISITATGNLTLQGRTVNKVGPPI